MENIRKQITDINVISATLWLVRHGQTDWNFAGRWQGQSPAAPPLNGVGLAQALALRDQLKGRQFSAVYSSDLLRARQTAGLLAEPLGMPVTLESRLREMDLGDWEGMFSSEIRTSFSRELEQRHWDPLHTPAPGGESPLQVAKRVLPAVDEIALRHAGESVLIVAHGISLAVITCMAQGIPLEKLYEHIPDNAMLVPVEWRLPRIARDLIHEKQFVV